MEYINLTTRALYRTDGWEIYELLRTEPYVKIAKQHRNAVYVHINT